MNAIVKAELKEELSACPLKVDGQIPTWLTGTLLRNGPVTVRVNGVRNNHWFDGLAMLHGFSFSTGQVHYSNKFLRTNAFQAVFKGHTLCYEGFAQDPCRSIFKKLFSWFLPKESLIPNANINITQLAESYVALFETPLPVAFDKKTLTTLGVFEFQDTLPKEKSWESAHPHYDIERNETINYLIEYGLNSHYVVYRVKEGSLTRDVIAKIPVKEPAYMHSFALTPNYVILSQFPFVVNTIDFLIRGKPFIENYFWDPARGTEWIVIDRMKGNIVGTYQTEPFFAFHHVNAYEDHGKIVLDLICYKDASIISTLATHFEKSAYGQEDNIPIEFRRFQISIKNSSIDSKLLWKMPIELPRINDAYHAKPYRYVYLADPREPSTGDDERPLYKLDLNTGAQIGWQEAGCYPGEPIFVAAPDAKKEDDGLILSVILDLPNRSSFLLILDAIDFKEIGRAYAPHQIPVGLHGQFYQ